jgi:pantoate--beta-alanine ligase
MRSTPVAAYIAIGANLGDRSRSIASAVEMLRSTEGIHSVRVSQLFENPSVGGPPDAPAFLNAAAELVTTLPAHALLHRLLEVEKALGRERRQKWEPRVIDLDLLLYADRIVSSDELVVPHPLMQERAFVLVPLAEIAPDVVHPVLQMTVRGLLDALMKDNGLKTLSAYGAQAALPQVVRTPAEFAELRGKMGVLGLVPTMGALHEGHLSLMRLVANDCQTVAATIFVNPTQFGPTEDLSRYPRDLEGDLRLCAAAGVRFVFVPDVGTMYPPDDPQVIVDVPELTGTLEGKHRPGHFRGVCQVVAKLFHICRPDVACFGRKDFQQLRVIQAMVRGLNLPVRIVEGPTIREPDGLAMSSRNRYLSPDERQRALSIHRGLRTAQDQFAAGVRQTNRLVASVQKTILDPGKLGRVPVSIDYVAAVDAQTLRPVEQVTRPTVIAVAARVGQTRLIDNLLLEPEA